jgi:hypothetical protein
MVYAKREGRQEGRQEGLQEGLQEGRQEGLQEGRIEFARKLLKRNRPIDEIIEDDAIKIYPNPTNGKVYIETERDIKVYNQQGELLLETFGNQVDLSTYPQGMYLLQINGRWSKVVKQ